MNPILLTISTYAPGVVGFAMPFLVEVINRDIKNEKFKFITTIGLCLLVAVLLHIPQLLVGSVEGLLASLTIIFTESQVVYKLWFKDSGLKQAMQRLPSVQPSN